MFDIYSNYVYTCTIGIMYTMISKITCTHVQCGKFLKQFNKIGSLRYIVKEAEN